MKRKYLKALIVKAQRSMAQRDYAIGLPPQKSSKTYINEYAKAYADGQIFSENEVYF